MPQNSIYAHLSLAKLYCDDKYTPRDMLSVLRHYEAAGKLGNAPAYEKLGDIYSSGADIACDFIKALECYDNALKLGSLSALRKYDEIKQKRIEFYNRALTLEKDLPKDAFSLYTLSADMGYAQEPEGGQGISVGHVHP